MESNGKSGKYKKDIEEIVKQEMSRIINMGYVSAKDIDLNLYNTLVEARIENKELQERINEYEKAGDPSQNKDILREKESLKKLQKDVLEAASEAVRKANDIKKEYEGKMANIDKSYIVREAELNKQISDIRKQYEIEKLGLENKISSLEKDISNKEKENTEALQSIREEIANKNSEHESEIKELKNKYDSEKIVSDLSHSKEIGALNKNTEDERKISLRSMIDIKKESMNLMEKYEELKKLRDKEIDDLKEKYLCLEDEAFVLRKIADAYENKILEEKVLGKKEESQYDEKISSQIEELGKNLDRLGNNFKKLQEGKDNNIYQKIEKIDKNLNYIVSRIGKPEAVASGAKNE